MRWKRTVRNALAGVLVGFAGGASAGFAQAADEWRAAALQDVRGAYEMHAAHHPGMHDPANPGFADQLARARDAGLAAAARAEDYSGYVEALGAYSAVLADGHALAFAGGAPAAPGTRQWPGFVAAWRGEGAIVHHAGSGAPAPAGTQIVSCNNLPIREFIVSRMASRNMRPAEAGAWWSSAPVAFYSTPNFMSGRPEICAFRYPSGEVRRMTLTWSDMPADFYGLLGAATDGERTSIGLGEPRRGIFLIGMPTFSPDEDGVRAYRDLFAALRRRRSELAAARAVVIDLRHNNGGSSAWSREAAEIMFGAPEVARRLGIYFRNAEIWWRASPENIAYLETLEQRLRGIGQGANADEVAAAAAGMRGALAAGQPFYRERSSIASARDGEATQPVFRAPIYLITPGRCASACLDALDLFGLFDNVRRIGAPTSADSSYMEVRAAELPSGRGTLVIPIKIWAGRPRAAGQVYTPHIPVLDRDWSTATFLDYVERDLARTAGMAVRERTRD